MDKRGNLRVGVYVDSSNVAMNGGYGIHYDVLREFSCRNEGVAMRLNAYIAYDEEEGKKNVEYRRKSKNFHAVLRDYGYKVIVKKVRRYYDDWGNVHTKANADLDMAVDTLMQSDRLDSVMLVTGDGDFIQVVRALQSRGCRVEVLAFQNVSTDLRTEADTFTSGYLVPDLLPLENFDSDGKKLVWGEVGSRVRGVCYSYHHEKGFGFMRFMKDISGGLWIMDSRRNESPYVSVFLHHSQLNSQVDFNELPSRDHIFEFTLANSERGLQAVDVELVYQY